MSTERGKGVRGRVLVIEADALVAEVLAFNIKHHGHDVAVAQTSDQAIQLAMKIEPNVLIVEPHLNTGLEGVDLANTIVSLYPFAEVIFATAYDYDVRLRSFKKPCKIISKPYVQNEIITLIDECLKHKVS